MAADSTHEMAEEKVISSDQSSEDLDLDAKKLLRKVDLRVLPVLFIVYVAAFLDRVNISAALTMSMPKELGLTGQQPNIALAVFFVPYVVFEVPSNILMKRLQPHVWFCILGFGIITLGQGFVRNYSGLLAIRFLLGLLEAGIFPGSFYLISFWYPRAEAQKRFTVYWCSVILASAFGGLLAGAIANMNGIQGLSNWRWIFILEGLATILIGIAAFFFIPNFPRETKWLTHKEREYIIAITRENEDHRVPITFSDIKTFFKNPKHLFAGVVYFAVVAPIYSLAYFMPTIIQSLGYGVVQTQLHAVVPFATAFGLCIITAYLSDRVGLRSPFVALGMLLAITGYGILLKVHGASHFPAEYAALCMVTMGGLTTGASIVCWYLMNLQGHAQRSIGSAWIISFGNCGGFVATFSFVKADAPLYSTGYSICMGVTVAGAVAAIGYALIIWRERKAFIRNSSEGVEAEIPSL